MKNAIIRIARLVKDVWEELEYADRRMLEIRTGIQLGDPPRRRRRIS
jgi:hypothetical protein